MGASQTEAMVRAIDYDNGIGDNRGLESVLKRQAGLFFRKIQSQVGSSVGDDALD